MVDMFTDDISKLVKETFDSVYNSHGNYSNELPESPGLFYHVELKEKVFVIRAIESADLAYEFDSLVKNKKTLKKLRLDNEASARTKLKFFECDDIFVAKAIVENFANKRYPVFEERVLNVSDPCDSWWLEKSENSLTLYFKLCRTEIMGNLLKLGPLGERTHVLEMFQKLYGYFSLLFEVKECSTHSGSFSISAENRDDKMFKAFLDIFEHGEIDYELMGHLRELETMSSKDSFKSSVRRANYFLMEIARKRGFWLEVQGDLKKES